MDIEVLKKKISTFKTRGGYLKNVSDDLLVEILDSWEHWEGSSRSFYAAYRHRSSQNGPPHGEGKETQARGLSGQRV